MAKKRKRIASYPTESGQFVFSRPTVWQGAARLLDFAGVFQTKRLPLSASEADRRAISCDWMVVGNDLNHAVRAYEQEAQRRLKSSKRELVGSV